MRIIIILFVYGYERGRREIINSRAHEQRELLQSTILFLSACLSACLVVCLYRFNLHFFVLDSHVSDAMITYVYLVFVNTFCLQGN